MRRVVQRPGLLVVVVVEGCVGLLQVLLQDIGRLRDRGGVIDRHARSLTGRCPPVRDGRSPERPRYGARSCCARIATTWPILPSGFGAVLLHPHPNYGGDRHNAVVDALFRALPASGVAAVRFDFASNDIGRGVAEAAEALDLLPADVAVDGRRLLLRRVRGGHVVHERVDGWALVAPPFGSISSGAGEPIAADARPKLLLAAAHDQFCPPSTARKHVESWAATELEEVPGADHFLGGATGAGRRPVDRLAQPVSILPDGDAGGGHDRLGLGDGVLAEVEDRRGQDGVGAALDDALDEVVERADAAAGDHGHARRRR